MTRVLMLMICALAISTGAARAQAPDACGKLAALALPQAKVISAAPVVAGDFTPPAQATGNANTVRDLPGFCRVIVNLTPSADSDIKSEVWLPAKWNGRLEMIGNGGWAGVISYNQMGEAIRGGYAGVATDTGHEGNRAIFALGHPEKVTDFGYRAVHETVVKAKQVTQSFYGKAPDYSYWNSCSTGGRQALMEAQRFPGDFNGIIAGAPATDMYLLHVAWMWDFHTTHETPQSVIPAAKLPAIQKAAIAACDELDGAKDGLISDPLRCRFNPATMICKGADGLDCLTAAQAAAVARVYAGPKTKAGKSVFPGNEPGSEFGWGFHSGETLPGQPPRDTLGYAIYGDANWDYRTFELETALADAKKADGGRVAATNPDLSGFFGRGGKLLMYHGWHDPNIPPRNTIAYYQSAVAKNGGLAKTYDRMRLFMLPGMGHCGGGYGPNQFDAMGAISSWVEESKAPETITARRETAGKVERTRPLCPYPQVARYSGSGSLDEEKNFRCVKPAA